MLPEFDGKCSGCCDEVQFFQSETVRSKSGNWGNTVGLRPFEALSSSGESCYVETLSIERIVHPSTMPAG